MTDQEAQALDGIIRAHRGVLLCDETVERRLRPVAARHPGVAFLPPQHPLYAAAVAMYHQYEFSDRFCVLREGDAETQALFRLCAVRGVTDEVLWQSLFA